jgi:hypothetical protein
MNLNHIKMEKEGEERFMIKMYGEVSENKKASQK